jgi:hypothetical protein
MGKVLSKFCDGVYIDSADRNRIRTISNNHIILVKASIGRYYDPNFINELKKRNNKIIYIVLDELSAWYDSFVRGIKLYHELYDLVLFPSKLTHNMFKDNVNSDVLYHMWDPKLKYNTSNNFNICYFGDIRPTKTIMVSGVDHVDCTGVPGRSSFYEDLLKYSCHYSVRDSKWLEFKYGVNTKLATAAGTRSNIICSKDTSFIELLDDYDYYVDSIDDVGEIIARAKKEFGSKKWDNNLKKMEKIRRLTSPENVSSHLKKLVSLLG